MLYQKIYIMKYQIDNLGKVSLTFNGQHDSNKAYDRLCCVFDNDSNCTYVSRKPVPSGVELSNEEYWQPFNLDSHKESIITYDDYRNNGNKFPIEDTKVLSAKLINTLHLDIKGLIETQGRLISSLEIQTDKVPQIENDINDCKNRIDELEGRVYNLAPISYIIDQRGEISDPDSMVSANYVKDLDGNLRYISESGATGDEHNNFLTWLRKNTHAYLGVQPINPNEEYSGIYLKQLADGYGTYFEEGGADAQLGTPRENAITGVWIKFPCDIYWKTESWTPEGETTPNEDYVLVTISGYIPEGEVASKWQKWDKNRLVASFLAKNEQPLADVELSNTYRINKSNLLNNWYKEIAGYKFRCLICYLFYGWYSTLDSQKICGYRMGYDEFGGEFWRYYSGNTASSGMKDSTLKDLQDRAENNTYTSTKFWGFEDLWGGAQEILPDFQYVNGNDISNELAKANITYVNYLDYSKGSTTHRVTTKNIASFNIAANDRFVKITTDDVPRYLKTKSNRTPIRKMYFGNHADLIIKDYAIYNHTYFADNFRCANFGEMGMIGGAPPTGDHYGEYGISCIDCFDFDEDGTTEHVVAVRYAPTFNEGDIHIVSGELPTFN